MSEQEKAPARVMRFDELEFNPRFEYGHMAEVAGICGSDDGTDLGAGIVRLTESEIPWTIKYDEVLTVLEGELTVEIDGASHHLKPLDSIWLPNGTALIYRSKSALVHYAIHPNNW